MAPFAEDRARRVAATARRPHEPPVLTEIDSDVDAEVEIPSPVHSFTPQTSLNMRSMSEVIGSATKPTLVNLHACVCKNRAEDNMHEELRKYEAVPDDDECKSIDYSSDDPRIIGLCSKRSCVL